MNSIDPHQNFLELLSRLKIQKRNLVYVIGLPKKIAKSQILEKYEFFGQYGVIERIFIDKQKPYNSGHTPVPSYGAFITYQNSFQSGLAILALDHFMYDDHKIKASFGMTRYCKYFLIGQICPQQFCRFIHELSKPEDIIKPNQKLLTKKNEVLEFLIKQPFLKNFLSIQFQDQQVQAEFPQLQYLQKIITNFLNKKQKKMFKIPRCPNLQFLNQQKNNNFFQFNQNQYLFNGQNFLQQQYERPMNGSNSNHPQNTNLQQKKKKKQQKPYKQFEQMELLIGQNNQFFNGSNLANYETQRQNNNLDYFANYFSNPDQLLPHFIYNNQNYFGTQEDNMESQSLRQEAYFNPLHDSQQEQSKDLYQFTLILQFLKCCKKLKYFLCKIELIKHLIKSISFIKGNFQPYKWFLIFFQPNLFTFSQKSFFYTFSLTLYPLIVLIIPIYHQLYFDNGELVSSLVYFFIS